MDGAFVELEKGVEGLVHISEMSWTRNVRHPSKVVSIGEEIEAVVLKVDPNDEKISLGMKQIEEDPWLALPVKYPTGTKLNGVVRNLTSFGAFVEIEPGIDGLVHVSDMSWTKRIEHPSEVVHKGQEVDVMVLDVDAENKRISLGVKQLQDDPWPTISERFAPGVEAPAKVARVQEKGIVMDLGDDIEGFVPVSHSGVEDAERLEEYYAEGDDADVRILESDAANRRIVAEVTEAPERKSQEEIDAARAAREAAAAEARGEGEEGSSDQGPGSEPPALREPEDKIQAAPEAEEAAKPEEAPAEAAEAEGEAAEAEPTVEEAPAEAEVEVIEAEAEAEPTVEEAPAEAEVEVIEAEAVEAEAEAEVAEGEEAEAKKED